jgi:hypothetical protein
MTKRLAEYVGHSLMILLLFLCLVAWHLMLLSLLPSPLTRVDIAYACWFSLIALHFWLEAVVTPADIRRLWRWCFERPAPPEQKDEMFVVIRKGSERG